MNIPKIAIDNYHIVCTVFFILLIASIVNFNITPRTEFPIMDVPMIAVVAQIATSNVEDMETQFLSPMEEALDELDDVDNIRSRIRGNMISIDIDFTYGIDIEAKLSQTKSILNFIQKDLPKELLNLSVHNYTTNKASILNIALLANNVSDVLLEKEAKRVQKSIRQITGVKNVKLDAYAKQEIQIKMDLDKLHSYGITFNDIENVLKTNNNYIPGGNLNLSSNKINVITSGAFKDISQLRETFIKTINGRYIHLKDIASIEYATEDRLWIMRRNGKEAPIIHIYQDDSADVMQVTKKIKDKIASLTLEGDIKIEYIYTQADEVKSQINMFFTNLGQGLLLVCLILFLVLGFRSALIIALFIPLSSFIGLMCANFLGLGLNQMAIVGMIVALGLLVDNSIAIVENIERLLDDGLDKLDACIQGVNQLLYPMISSTFTTMAVFIPIIFMPDTTGEFIKPMPVVVLFTMLASLIIAITLAPVLCYFFLGKDKWKPLSGVIKKLENKYHTLLAQTLKNRKKVLAGTMVLFLGTLMLFPSVGVTFFPKADKQFFLIQIKTKKAKNLNYTDKVVAEIEDILKDKKGVKAYTTSVGHGTPTIYYNLSTKTYSNNYADIFVESSLINKAEFNSFIESLRIDLLAYTKANINLVEYSQGLGDNHPLEVIVKGDNLEELQNYSSRVVEKMEKVDGIININNSFESKSLNLELDINYKEAARLGIQESQIDKEIKNLYNGSTIGSFINLENNKQNIKLNYKVEDNQKIEAIKNIRIKTATGHTVPLSNLVELRLSNSINQLSHYNSDRISMISADIKDETELSNILATLGSELDRLDWRVGYSYSFKGDFENRDESFGQLGFATIIAIFLILTILIAQYKSFLIPAIIISILPLTIIGSILALWLTGQSFSFTAFVGLISLIGICINDSIILVDFSYELFKKGYSKEEAILTAAKTRLVPVLMTSITTIFGLFFLALNGGSLWTPMAITIIGGLIGTTFFVLIIIPILFFYTCRFLKPKLKLQATFS